MENQYSENYLVQIFSEIFNKRIVFVNTVLEKRNIKEVEIFTLKTRETEYNLNMVCYSFLCSFSFRYS